MSRAHLSLVGLACFALSAGAAMAQDNTKKIITSNPTPNVAPAIPRSVYAPLLRSPELPYAEIALNNRSPQATEATLTFHRKDGQAWQAPAITVGPGEVKHINLDDILPDELKYQLELGGLFVQYTGQWNQVASQLTLITRDRKGSIDEVLRPDTDFRSGAQDAVWYIPEHGKTAIALGNTTNADISATLVLPGGESHPVLLRPFETRLIVVNQNTDPQGGGTNRVESVHVETSAPAGALRAIGYVTFRSGLARTIRFYQRATVRQPHLFAANLPIQNSEIQMVLKNIGDQPLTATPRFLPVSPGPVSPVELPAVTLQPGEAKLVDCSAIQDLAASNSAFSRVSVQVRNSGEKGALIGSLASVNLQTGISYEIPLRDSGSLRNSGGGYPIRLDGDYSTFVTLFNVSDEPAEFTAVVRHNSDDYVFRPRTLAPGESAIFDIRDLRDRKVPDPNGKTLPADFERGQFNWSMVQGGAVTRLIGRSEIVSPSRGVSASYSCGVCCPDSGPVRLFDPWQLALAAGGMQFFTAREQYTNCYNQIWSEPTSFSFTSRNPSIADSYYVDYGQAEGHGYAPGSTVQSTGDYTYWHYWDDGNDCYYEPWLMESDQDVSVNVTTDDVVVIAWVNGSAIGLPAGANQQLIDDLNTPGSCSALVGDWALFSQRDLNSQADRDYANAFLVRNSGNAEPFPGINPDAFLSGGDFRLYNRFKVRFSLLNGTIVNLTFLQTGSVVGKTPDPCHILSPVSGQAHNSNGARGVTGSGAGIYQLTEGRIGTAGQNVFLTINGRSTPWIWSVIRFDASGNLNHSDRAIFPTYYVYKNAELVFIYPQSSVFTFVQNDASYQRVPSQIQ